MPKEDPETTTLKKELTDLIANAKVYEPIYGLLLCISSVYQGFRAFLYCSQIMQ